MNKDDFSEEWKGSSGDGCVQCTARPLVSSLHFSAHQCLSTLSYLESLRLGRADRKRLYEYTLVYPYHSHYTASTCRTQSTAFTGGLDRARNHSLHFHGCTLGNLHRRQMRGGLVPLCSAGVPDLYVACAEEKYKGTKEIAHTRPRQTSICV
jgi:hypothetical protein